MKITHAFVVKLVDKMDLKSLPFWNYKHVFVRGTTK